MTRPMTPALILFATLLSACNGVPEENADDEVPVDGQVLALGDFIDGAHPTSGKVEIVEDDAGTVSLVMTDFLSDNGPDLFVYLATDTSASDIIDLGALRATSGTLNYELPSGSYDAEYDHVLIWCDQFSVLFGSAELSPASP